MHKKVVVWGPVGVGGLRSGGQGGCERRIEVIVKTVGVSGSGRGGFWSGGEGVLVGEGGWQYLNQKHSQVIKKKKKRLTETGLEPTTPGLENLPSYPLGLTL